MRIRYDVQTGERKTRPLPSDHRVERVEIGDVPSVAANAGQTSPYARTWPEMTTALRLGYPLPEIGAWTTRPASQAADAIHRSQLLRRMGGGE